jgi:hypothetical protein
MKGWQFRIIRWPTALEGYSPLLKKPALRVADCLLRKKNALDKEKKQRRVKKEL